MPLCNIINLQVLIVEAGRPVLCCPSMQHTRFTIAGCFCELAMPYKMCISLVFAYNTSNILIKYKYVTSVMVKHKYKHTSFTGFQIQTRISPRSVCQRASVHSRPALCRRRHPVAARVYGRDAESARDRRALLQLRYHVQ